MHFGKENTTEWNKHYAQKNMPTWKNVPVFAFKFYITIPYRWVISLNTFSLPFNAAKS